MAISFMCRRSCRSGNAPGAEGSDSPSVTSPGFHGVPGSRIELGEVVARCRPKLHVVLLLEAHAARCRRQGVRSRVGR